MEAVAALIAATLSAGTPLLLAAVGLLLNERAGVLNLGAEGMMLVAAAVGFAAGFHSGSVTVALIAGAGAGVAVSLASARTSFCAAAREPPYRGLTGPA